MGKDINNNKSSGITTTGTDTVILTPKQQRFIEEYLIDLNATQAAIRAGYSEKTAKEQGYENLTKPHIHAEIERLFRERSERTKVTQDYVIKGFCEVAERCLQRKPVMVFNREERCMEQMIDEETGNGVWQFDSTGANRAFEMLGRHLGLFEKDNEQKTQPIQVTIIDRYESGPGNQSAGAEGEDE